MIKHQDIKQRFGIIGNSNKLDRAISTALQIAPTDISVLITGESGVGKEAMPKIIHYNSQRKHNKYIAVNCGAIPEGTIDSELFGHEKGAFTGASDNRQGYFEVADGGTIFLDEVGELPLSTQVRLLRVLESGEFMKVGSSQIKKVDIRVIAATNVNIEEAIQKGKFREDLFYRLNTINVKMPSLRERIEDIHLLFRKFAADFADRYHIPPIRLEEDAVDLLQTYSWPGNIRQLKNVAEQISAVEQDRSISKEILINYIPKQNTTPVLFKNEKTDNDFSEREILYKVLFDMKNDLNDLKRVTKELMGEKKHDIEEEKVINHLIEKPTISIAEKEIEEDVFLTLHEQEKILIEKALKRHQGRRKDAAEELGISERTLYRKIKEYLL
ncbi:MAG: sigma-54 dependent transcriptional regulator [Flavobacteriales bacterium]|jgi:transcriptional regulator with PAS, ATPase and Fis domain|nr:sigma-54 dependent transcriptional regulator [Flavobacteriales bacterium]|tara:strand:+ start:2345 stop:3499 length:1155 start_codon:yes stop_codon:yes gene_type:complete